jgi:hypothetical protein
MPQPIIQRTFAAGELAPVLHARADAAKYASGLKTCRNFLVRREGGVSNRGGLRFVASAKNWLVGTRLIRYVGSTSDDSALLELGDGYLRVFHDGGPVEVTSVPAWDGGTAYIPGDHVVYGGTNYYCFLGHTNHAPPNATYWYPLTDDIVEIPTPFTVAAGLPDWNQSGNVIVFTHPDLPPYELVFEELERWVLRAVTTSPGIVAPTSPAGTRNAPGGLSTFYKITAAAAESGEESEPSSVLAIYNHDTLSAAVPNWLDWVAVTGAAEYHIYADRYNNGTFGYIGTSTGKVSFRDGGQSPDLTMTPPMARTPFAATGSYPRHSANYQQRRYFANTDDEPDAVWGSRTGFPSNFGVSSPLQDDDAVTFRLAGNNHHPILHMVALKLGLVLLTEGGEWTLTGGAGAGSPITPSSVSADQETYVGAAAGVRPCVIGEEILYVQARGSVMRSVRFHLESQGLAGVDLSIWSSHLLERQTLIATDYQQVPHSIVWALRSDGVLLGMTYVPEQEVAGWHRHDTTNGIIEDICVVPEDDEDALYCLVARVIGGSTKRYIERLERRDIRATSYNADSFFVDSGLSYSGAPADVFGGLDHLEGEVVAVLADGEVIYDGDPDGADAASFTVTAGEITLNDEYSDVHIGLRLTSEVETLDLDVSGNDVRARQKRVASLTLLVEKSGGSFKAGLDDDHVTEFEPSSWEGDAPYTGAQEIGIDAEWNNHGRVLIQQTDPLPLTILGIIPNVDAGGV